MRVYLLWYYMKRPHIYSAINAQEAPEVRKMSLHTLSRPIHYNHVQETLALALLAML